MRGPSFETAWLAAALLAVAAGCTPASDDDDSAGADDDSAGADDDTAGDDDVAAGATHAVVTTTDYSVGSLALVELDGWAVQDEIVTTSGDPSVTVDDGTILVVNAFGADNLTAYDPEDFSAPLFQVSTGAGSNPRRVASCGGAYFVTRYEEASLLVLDPGTGQTVGTVDLSGWDDGDGTPEAFSAVALDDTLYVSLQRFERAGYVWTPAADGGRILEIDCGTRTVLREFTTGPSPTLARHPMDPGKLLVFEGVYYDETFAVAQDGGARVLDPGTGALDAGYTWPEAEVGGNLAGFGGLASGKGILAVGTDTGSRIYCADLAAGTATLLDESTSFVNDVAADDRGDVWVVQRVSWLDPESDAGLRIFEAETCTERTAGGWIATSLEPYAVAFL